MKIETKSSGVHASLILRGEFNTDSADSFLATIEQVLADGQSRLSVSFRYVKYLNSTALGSIVRARTKCKEQGGDLVITRPSPMSRQIVTSMGLDSVLVLFDDEAEATNFLDGHGDQPEAPSKAASQQHSTVMFSFDDARSELFPGKSHRGVAQLESVNEHGLMFSWNAAAHDVADEAATEMFKVGASIHCKLQLKLLRKEFFAGDGSIQAVTKADSGELSLAVVWTDLPNEDKDALKRHSEEIGFLNRQSGASSGG